MLFRRRVEEGTNASQIDGPTGSDGTRIGSKFAKKVSIHGWVVTAISKIPIKSA
jgi:hypothetical protein